ncbi:tumor necrosis factor receptor superfamily member 19 [Gadus chalcogrammus]|uniref:tumor necrosis factor receptor superfamily member 19 n=1 Tax=Gadus chalcogrammus TaxID=1042646 RepID=UPI0024C4C4BA|nr:tumor necrosis factor receptor superfamily member 19 [Gadus chalcogrammus]
MARMLRHISLFILTVQIIFLLLVPVGVAEESRGCREQEYRDLFGTCKACQQCDAGQELSKECGFGYGVDARCVGCRSARFKEDRGLQKCKPCLDCGLLNRFQKANCSATRNAACGDCLPGYYRKTKLSGFQDMECILCGDQPPPYEPHCSGRVNRVPLPSVPSSPRDMALAAVICSALVTVLLALLVLCVIYCKRQLLEKKPGASMRLQDGPYSGAELSCLDRRWHPEFPDPICCQCHLGPGHTCGPVHLIPSLCWDESCRLGLDSRGHSAFHSQMSLSYGTPNQDQDQDHDGPQDHSGPEPPPGAASAETWLPERSESPVTPQHSPEVERCGTAEEEEVVVKEEEGVEEVEEVVEERSLLGEDVQMSSPDRSALEG